MIGKLTGRLAEENADGTAILDVNGVGYELTVPLGTIGRASADPSAPLTLFVHTLAREDALLLYGFATREDRDAFRVLISISNVGPKTAVSILSALSARELSTVLSRGETARLTAIPGIGKKTAERILLELKDKLIVSSAPAGKTQTASSPAPVPAGKSELLHGALTRMGFRPAEADRALAALGARVENETLGDLVREALVILSR